MNRRNIILSAMLLIAVWCVSAGSASEKKQKKSREKQTVCRVFIKGKKETETAGSFRLDRISGDHSIRLSLPEILRKEPFIDLILEIDGPKHGVVFDSVTIVNSRQTCELDQAVAEKTFRDYAEYLRKNDKYVVRVTEKRLKLSFHSEEVFKGKGPVLRIRGYVPLKKVPSFVIPSEKKWMKFTKGKSTGYVTLDGEWTGKDKIPDPIKKIAGISTSGHPDGIMYFYAFNDFRNFYIVVDYTPDNTEEPADNIEIEIKAGDRTFLFKEGNQGVKIKKGFCITRNAEYPHRYYEFMTSLDDLLEFKSSSVEYRISVTGVRFLR